MDYSKKESPKEKTPSGSARFSGPELGAASVSQSSILNCHASVFLLAPLSAMLELAGESWGWYG